jgi:hypothetical protein
MNIPAKWRKAIYIGAVVLLTGTVAVGVISPDQLTVLTDDVVKILGALAAVLAFFNVRDE